MYQKIQILNSKLLLPHLKDIIHRERLHHIMNEIPNKQLTTVIAGAGFGKTTLIAQACNYSGFNSVWYRLDKSDNDFITFINYLIAGIQNHFPGFGVETRQRIGEARDMGWEREAITTIFLSEIDKYVNKDLIIVFDDYHYVHDSREINETIEFILKNLSPLVHLTIISRADPGLPISLLRARRQALEIKEDDLALSISEIEQLYSQLFNITLETQSLEKLRRKTEGWVSGLILFYHGLRGRSAEDVNKLLSKLKGSHKIISSYLEENVYELQPDEAKDFLIKTSILSHLDIDFCNRFLEIQNSGYILKALEEKHLFTISLDEDSKLYRFHHLFQEFLQNKLANELGQEGIQRLHKDAAKLWEKQHEDEETLKHYLMADQLDKAWNLLRKLGMRLYMEGRVNHINSYLEKIPDTYRDKESWTQYAQALALDVSKKPQEAIQNYKKAYKTFRYQKSSKGVVLSLNSLGYNYFIDGDYLTAERKLKELLSQVEDNPKFCISILTNLMTASLRLGKPDEADKYFNKAASMIKLSNVENEDMNNQLLFLYVIQGNRYLFTGDYAKAQEIGEQIKYLHEEKGLNVLLAMYYYLLIQIYYFKGQFSKGMIISRKCLDLFNEMKLHEYYRALVLIYASRNAVELGEIEEAINNSRESLKLFKDMKSRWGQALAYQALYVAYMKTGNLLEAKNCVRRGLEVIKGLTLPLEEGLLKWSLAEYLITMGQWKEALSILEDAEELLKFSKLHLSKVYLLFARLYWEQNQREAALSKLYFYLELCEANQYDNRVISEKNWIIPLLVELYAQGKMLNYLNTIFEAMGLKPDDGLSRIDVCKNTDKKDKALLILNDNQNASPGLSIYCLGSFRVFRGDEEIPAEKWRSKKAKMLLKYLIYARPRGFVQKEVLMEILWPEEDPVKSVARMHDTLSALRKTLEPDRKRGAPSSYIIREADSYKIDLGDNGKVDIDKFTGELRLAEEEKNPEQELSHYLNAEAVYKGDFLEEDIYVDWCAEVRTRLKEDYLNLLLKIMTCHERKGDYSMCIEYAKKSLDMDKYAETIYQHLMRYYSLTGNKAMMGITFERCKNNIRKNNSSLNKETETLYLELS